MSMYRIEEFPDVWADACLRDSEGDLMFLSAYGRDGALMQMLAAFELSSSERGTDHIHLVGKDGQRHRADIGATSRLAKHAGKLPKQNLFGPLGQLWLFDKGLQAPDRANRIGWALNHSGAAQRTPEQAAAYTNRVWQLLNLLSPIALQDGWREAIFAWCADKQAMQKLDSTLYPALGPVEGMRISLTDHFIAFVSESVRQGLFKLDPL